MSCSMTVDAVKERRKTVTRRHINTWRNLQPGDRLILVEKAQGLRKGERQRILAHVEITDVRYEALGLVDEAEVEAEGFPGDDPGLWRVWWASSHGYGIPPGMDDPEDVLDWVDLIRCTRIEWRYLDEADR